MRDIGGTVREWYRRNFTFKGLGLLALLVLREVPDWFGIKDFWKSNLFTIWQFVLVHSTTALIICIGILIWLDHRAVLKKLEPKPHDPTTLKGRILQLRDDMQKFLEQLGAAPHVTREPKNLPEGTTIEAYQRKEIERVCLWSNKLMHGYALRFDQRVRTIFHECGEAGTRNDPLWIRMTREYQSEATFKEIMDDLTWLANQVD
jgi:hypothetical protein